MQGGQDLIRRGRQMTDADSGGVLQGVKGQYLIFADGVLNARKFTGYQVEISDTA